MTGLRETFRAAKSTSRLRQIKFLVIHVCLIDDLSRVKLGHPDISKKLRKEKEEACEMEKDLEKMKKTQIASWANNNETAAGEQIRRLNETGLSDENKLEKFENSKSKRSKNIRETKKSNHSFACLSILLAFKISISL